MNKKQNEWDDEIIRQALRQALRLFSKEEKQNILEELKNEAYFILNETENELPKDTKYLRKEIQSNICS